MSSKKKSSGSLSQKRIDLLTHAYNTLTKLTLFSELSSAELWEFCSVIEFEKYKNNELIASEGEVNSKLYIVSAGEVIVSKKTAMGEPYVINIIDSSPSGSTFLGEVSLVDEHVRTASIVASGAVELYSITGDVFNQFCDNHQEIGYKILKILVRSICRHLRRSNNDVLTLFNALVEETKRGVEEEAGIED